MNSISNIISQLPIDRSGRNDKHRLSTLDVDILANELVVEYSNPNYRRWYCQAIYNYGVPQVLDWRKRAAEGDVPARLFSKFVKEANDRRGRRTTQGA